MRRCAVPRSGRGSLRLKGVAFALCGVLLACPAMALTQDQGSGEENSTPHQDPNATAQNARPGEPLGKRLGRTEGVIKPPADVDPGIAAPAPEPNPGTTPVIPPPGSPGGNPDVQPR